ncbi:MAG: FAD-dependent oxidoreductase [Syntrophomonadaceae bacterium]|nr:FAD-dependent oxidoreductase [Syntrophomonadaceae bacterium]
MSKTVIVGGVAAGASTAARLRRLDENAEIVMFERGEHISFANCGLPYYINGTIPKRSSLLVQTPEAMHARFNLDIRTMSEVREILKDEKKIRVTNVLTKETYYESYDYLVLCPGAQPFVPDIPGIDKANVFSVRNIPDSDNIKHYVETNGIKKATVLGGGFIGLEMLEVLNEMDIETTLVEASSQVMNGLDQEMSNIIHNYLAANDIKLLLNERAVFLEGDDLVSKVNLSSGNAIDTELVILGAGVKPETWLAEEAGLELGSTGGILVDDYLKTSDPYIYAAGDAVQIKDFVTGEDILVPLAGPANRQGWIVANNIAGRNIKYTGSQGTGILKLMDLTAAMTGKNEKQLRNLGIDYLTCKVHPASHATYYPGSNQMTLKLIFTPKEGKVLGAQIVGYDGVDKRIDVLATSIRAGLNVFDLQELELAYAPPFSSAKDPVNMAAYAAGNILNEDVKVVNWEDVPDLVANGAYLIDMRTEGEVKRGQVPGAHNICVDELRDRLDEIPKDKEILLYCQVGIRSYIGNRILLQNGFKVKNIIGGYKSYCNSK